MQLTYGTVFKAGFRYFKVFGFGRCPEIGEFFQIYEVEEIKDGFRKIYVQSGNPFNRNEDLMNKLYREGKLEFIAFSE